MAVSVTLPALGESVTEGTVTRWLKAEGEHVEADEPLLEVSTDKVDTEIPSPAVRRAGVHQGRRGRDGRGRRRAGRHRRRHAAPPPRPRRPPPSPRRSRPRQPAPAAEPPPVHRGRRARPGPDRPRRPPARPAPPGTDVVLPALGESVTEGTVTRWLKAVGETVEADEPLLEVSTDKVDTEIPSPVAGTLLEILVRRTRRPRSAPARGDRRRRCRARRRPRARRAGPRPGRPGSRPGRPGPGSRRARPPPPAPAPAPAAAAPAPAPAAPAPARRAGRTGRSRAGAPADDGAYVTPLVRKLAAENGVDLARCAAPASAAVSASRTSLAAAEAAKAAAAAPPPRPRRPPRRRPPRRRSPRCAARPSR